jgi:hypothetical protein
MKYIKIYKLIDPITNEIRYIGKTKNILSKRYNEHMSRAKKGHNSHVYYWISNLLKDSLKPIIELVEECTENNWEEREKYWISFYPNLTNISKGGVTYFGQYNKRPDFISPVIKKVIKYDMNGIFICIYDSIVIASKGNESLRKHISCCCKGNRQSADGFQWKYYTENYFLKINPYVKVLSKSLFVKGNTINKGKSFSDEHKKKLSLSHIDRVYKKRGIYKKNKIFKNETNI